jgi:hypothetical protein
VSPALLAIIGTVLGGLMAGGAVGLWLAPWNRRKLEAETRKLTEETTATHVQSVTQALDRQDKTIARQDSEMVAARTEIGALGDRVTFLEKALETALAAAGAAAALAAGRIVILRGEVGRLGGDIEIGLRGMGIEIADASPPADTDGTAEESPP